MGIFFERRCILVWLFYFRVRDSLFFKFLSYVIIIIFIICFLYWEYLNLFILSLFLIKLVIINYKFKGRK